MKIYENPKKTIGFSNVEKIIKNKKSDKKNEGITYKGIKELKEDLEKNNKMKEKFKNVKNQDEAIKLAKDLGYEIDAEDIKNNEELAENILELIAGGSSKVKIRNYSFSSDTIASGDRSDVKTCVKWDTGRK